MTSVVMDIIARDHFSAQFIKAGAEAEGLAKKVSTTGSKIGSALKVGAAVGVAAVVTLAAASVELASKFEDSQKRLETALKASGSSFEALKGPIAAADKQMEKLGFTNTQTADAIANLTVATKNPVKSLQLLGVTADLARFKHISLAEAATAVGKAMAGNLRPIKQLGIDLPVAASSALKVATATTNLAKAQDVYNVALATYQRTPTAANMAKMQAAAVKLQTAHENLNKTTSASNIILKTLSERLGGQAQAAASTLAGKTEVLRARFEDMGIKIGTVLIPALITLVDKVSSVTDWFQKHATVTKTLAYVLGTLLVIAIGHVVVAWVAANVAFVATPVGALITALILLGFTIMQLAKNWQKAWSEVKIATLELVRLFLENFLSPLLTIFSAIIHGAAAAFGWIPGVGGKLKSARDKFDEFRRGVDHALANIKADIHTEQALQKIRDLQAKIDAIKQGRQPGLNANNAAGRAAIAQLQAQIDGLRGKTVAVKLVYDKSAVGGGGAAIGGRAVSGATGGFITGPGGPRSDVIPLLASNGEFMMNAASVAKYGVGFMQNLNAQKFASGGPIYLNLPSNPAGSLSSVENLLRPSVSSMLGGGAGGPATVGGSLGAWIAAALGITGTPGSWAGAIQRRIMFESGGNPNAQNNWDSNAMAGDPSRGLMQTIMSTFMGNHQPGTSFNIFDPVANIAAAINYIKGRYGSIFAIDPPVQGYAKGGVVDRTGLAYLHRGETVTPADGAAVVELGPKSLAALANQIIQMDGEIVARLVTKQQTAYAQRGGRR